MTQRGRAAGRSTARPRAGERPRNDASARRLRLRAVIEPVVTAAGYDLEDLSVSRAGRRHVVRVIVDGDGGIGLDAVAEVSRAVSVALDQAEESGGDLVAGEYQLEVSSPGVDRPLTLPRHWRRNVGRLVRVTTRAPGQPPEQRRPDRPGEVPAAGEVPGQDEAPAAGEVPGQDEAPGPAAGDRQVTGRVVTADEHRVVLRTDAGPAEWLYADLGPGRVQVEFSRLDEGTDEDLQEFDDTGDDEDVEGEER